MFKIFIFVIIDLLIGIVYSEILGTPSSFEKLRSLKSERDQLKLNIQEAVSLKDYSLAATLDTKLKNLQDEIQHANLLSQILKFWGI